MPRYLPDQQIARWLPLSDLLRWLPMAKRSGVSTVATSSAGFLGQYRRAGGNPARMSEAWHRKRAGFLRRHWAQVHDRNEALWDDDGMPTRRHLALIMWAWSPHP